jgi:hypothetical protein
MEKILANWDIITLIITNIGALFVKQPHKWMKKDEVFDYHDEHQSIHTRRNQR